VDGNVAVEVADQGIGIAPEYLSQVFDRFRRPGAPATTRGMGLGLYLVRLLVEAQGGSIAAASAGPGHGSTFTVTLPVAHGWDESDEEHHTDSTVNDHDRGDA
jgi:signal transduction histidine kinase